MDSRSDGIPVLLTKTEWQADCFTSAMRYALRLLLKTPGFTIAAVLSIGLGIGANAVIFTWLKAVLLNPVPGVQASGRLLTMNASYGERNGISNTYADYRYFAGHTHTFQGLLAHELVIMNLGVNGRPEIVGGAVASANYFDVLGIKPFLGRTFAPEEDSGANAHPVAVLSYKLWERRFDGDRGVLGKPILINGQKFTVIGVAPPSFEGTYGGLAQEIWVPVMMSKVTGRGPIPESSEVQIMGRLKDGATLGQAQADIAVLAAQLAQTDPASYKRFRETVNPLEKAGRGIQSSLYPVIRILMAMAGIVLLIACANVANLLLARSTTRAREIGIRLALGASRWHLLRQLLTESLLLSVLGGLLGLLITAWTTGTLGSSLRPALGGGIALALDLGIDWRVLLFSAAVTLLTGILFGLAPAFHASNANVGVVLKEGSRSVVGGGMRSGLQGALVVTQMVLSLVALVCAGLFARTVQAALKADPGFDTRNVLLTSYDAFLNGYGDARGQLFYRQLLERVAAKPGVVSASLTSFVPLRMDGGGSSCGATVEGYVAGADEPAGIVCDSAGPDYFRTMRIPLLRGRDFNKGDRAGSAPVALVNDTMARRFWPAGNAVGGRVKVGSQWREVAGVVRDFKYRSVRDDPEAHLFLPVEQQYASGITLVVRTVGNPLGALAGVQNEVSLLDPNMPVSRVETMAQNVANSLVLEGLALKLLSAFGLVALVLTAVGMYGIMAYFVSQRTREIGIRMALGAPRGRVLGMVLGRGMLLAGIGIALGLGAAWFATQLLASMLYGVPAHDPWTFSAVAAMLVGVAAMACFLPARRASLVDPMVALRYE